MSKAFKYGTGDEIPEGAVYLSTVVEKRFLSNTGTSIRYVWHYFLIAAPTDKGRD